MKMNYDNIHISRWEEIPDFPLYIDQVVSIIEKSLSFLKNDNDAIITKTMINNYVKHKLVKAPIKKKYEREQIVYFTLICLLKSVFSLDEISKLIQLQQSQKELSELYNKCILSSVYKIKVSDNLLGEETMEEALKKN